MQSIGRRLNCNRGASGITDFSIATTCMRVGGFLFFESDGIFVVSHPLAIHRRGHRPLLCNDPGSSQVKPIHVVHFIFKKLVGKLRVRLGFRVGSVMDPIHKKYLDWVGFQIGSMLDPIHKENLK